MSASDEEAKDEAIAQEAQEAIHAQEEKEEGISMWYFVTDAYASPYII